MKKLWRFLLEALEALVDDDRERQNKAHEDRQRKFLSYLGSGR